LRVVDRIVHALHEVDLELSEAVDLNRVDDVEKDDEGDDDVDEEGRLRAEVDVGQDQHDGQEGHQAAVKDELGEEEGTSGQGSVDAARHPRGAGPLGARPQPEQGYGVHYQPRDAKERRHHQGPGGQGLLGDRAAAALITRVIFQQGLSSLVDHDGGSVEPTRLA